MVEEVSNSLEQINMDMVKDLRNKGKWLEANLLVKVHQDSLVLARMQDRKEKERIDRKVYRVRRFRRMM